MVTKKGILLVDYDDGFVSYINGVEFARSNLGSHGSKTNCNQVSDRSHEAEYYRMDMNIVSGYYIDDTIVDKHIVNGINYLSIEVHNDSAKGSDLSLVYTLLDLKGYYNMYDLACRYKRSMELDSTHLPIVKIETNEFGIPTKRIEVPASISIIDNDSGKYNKPGDSASGYSGPISIELRGESSSNFPKKPYDFETQDADGNDTSIALCGLPKENDWVLQGPFADRSQIRNALIYDLARKSGQWHPRVKFVELIMNGEYVGLYNLVEKIKRDSARLPIKKLKNNEVSGVDLTGGYILKYDKPTSSYLNIVYPKESDLQPEQEDYIRNFVKEYESILLSNKGLDEELGYKKYISPNSLIDYVIISELAKNCDAYYFSTYMYKDREDINDKLMFGPIWDFDLCFGNAYWQNGNKTNGWQFEYPTNKRFNLKRLFQDPDLVYLFRNRWYELRDSHLHTDSIIAEIDKMVDTLKEPLKRNYEVWPIINENTFYLAYDVVNYEEEIQHIKNWIKERTTWIDNNISNLYYPVTIYPSDIEQTFATKIANNIYPNPFSENLSIDLSLKNNSSLSIRLISLDGRIISVVPEQFIGSGNYVLKWVPENCPNGLYLLELLMNGKVEEQYKVLKMNANF